MLELRDISLRVDNEIFVDKINLTLQRGHINILLGPTLAGKTSLMRLMAGLDQPDSGELIFDGVSVLGKPVQQRRIAMVYQQFINYPTLSVYENIASPLRVARLPKAEIETRVMQAAELLQLKEFLSRNPSELSGGQQQRVAIARALVKRAELVLLDEPLANLDYKLREELRSELPALFAELGSVLVYATTEPMEALALGGMTACMHQGRVVQFGETLALFKHPEVLQAARIFSDPPLNTVEVKRVGGQFVSSVDDESESLSRFQMDLPDGHYTLGIRPHHLSLAAGSELDLAVHGVVSVTELSGSESFIHFAYKNQPWVALAHGISDLPAGQQNRFYVAPKNILVFDQNQNRVVANSRSRNN